MNKKIRAAALFTFIVIACGVGGAAQAPRTEVPPSAVAIKFLRTELYFGRSKPDGTLVTESEWSEFLSDVVSPRFPEGFTILSGKGQYRNAKGAIISESSEVLVIMYPSKGKRFSRSKIEEIRYAYKKRFDQESVLRVDVSSAKVYF